MLSTSIEDSQTSREHSLVNSVITSPSSYAHESHSKPVIQNIVKTADAKRDNLIITNKSSNLPQELPSNMIYWIRCETKVKDNCTCISNSDLQTFYSKTVSLQEDLKLAQSTNEIEIEHFYQDSTFDIDGQIELSNPSEDTFFFNSKFESGNLRQAFKVPQNINLLPSPVGVPLFTSEYNLYLQDDTNNDNSLTQWFFFSVRNIKKDAIIKLNILNLMKDDSLYSQGMKPFIYSSQKKESDGTAWHRGGYNISYDSNGSTIRTNSKTVNTPQYKFRYVQLDHDFDPTYCDYTGDKYKQLSTMTFQYQFEHDNDIVFFAHFVPYTYKDMVSFIGGLQANKENDTKLRIDGLCRSLGGNICYCLTITNNLQDQISAEDEVLQFRKVEYIEKSHMKSIKDKKKKKKKKDQLENKEVAIQSSKKQQSLKSSPDKKNNAERFFDISQLNVISVPISDNIDSQELVQPKKYIVITSRVHPGESNASYLVHGVIDFLLSDDPEAQELREKFIFKIIPMLNPDGVIYGNYRSSLLGVDLNRRWKNPSKYLHPTIYYAKSLIKFLNSKKKSNVVMTCDFHGHSRKNNFFMYACVVSGNDQNLAKGNQVIHSIPESVHQICPLFSIKDCKFACEKEKESTARIVLFKELGILNSYTLECTFFGSDFFKKPRVMKVNQNNQSILGATANNIGEGREDIHITIFDLIDVGKDFCKGINQAQLSKAIQKHWFQASIKKSGSPSKKNQNQVKNIIPTQLQQPTKIIEGKRIQNRKTLNSSNNQTNNNSELISATHIQQVFMKGFSQQNQSRAQLFSRDSKTFQNRDADQIKENSDDSEEQLPYNQNYTIQEHSFMALGSNTIKRTNQKVKKFKDISPRCPPESQCDNYPSIEKMKSHTPDKYSRQSAHSTHYHESTHLRQSRENAKLKNFKIKPYQQIIRYNIDEQHAKSLINQSNTGHDNSRQIGDERMHYHNIDTRQQSKKRLLRENHSAKSLSEQVKDINKIDYDNCLYEENYSPNFELEQEFNESPQIRVNNRIYQETINRVKMKNGTQGNREQTPMKLPFIIEPINHSHHDIKTEEKIRSQLHCSLNQKVNALAIGNGQRQQQQAPQNMRKGMQQKMQGVLEDKEFEYRSDCAFVPPQIIGPINSLHPLLQQNIANKITKKTFQIKEYSTNGISNLTHLKDAMRMTSMCNFKSPVHGPQQIKSENESFIDNELLGRTEQRDVKQSQWQAYQNHDLRSFHRVASNIQQQNSHKRSGSKSSIVNTMPRTFYAGERQQKLLNFQQTSSLGPVNRRGTHHQQEAHSQMLTEQEQLQNHLQIPEDQNLYPSLSMRSDWVSKIQLQFQIEPHIANRQSDGDKGLEDIIEEDRIEYCGMMLNIQSTQSLSQCKFCHNVTDLSSMIGEIVVTKKEFNQKKDWLDGIQGNLKKERPTVQEECPKCNHDLMYYTTMQTRSVDEASTVFYECVKCAYTFSVNN